MDLKIITTGGTIDKIYFDAKSEFQIGDPQIAQVLHESNVTIDFEVVSVMRKDSLDLTDTDRKQIYDVVASDDDCCRFVITHGTDTMVTTAQTLLPLAEAGKTIVFTGSMMPARFRLTDAVYNIASAVTAAQLLPPGTYIAMNGRIFDPTTTVKNVAENRFESSGS